MPTFQHNCLQHALSTQNGGTVAGEQEVWGGPLADGGFVLGLLNRADGVASAGTTIRANWTMLEMPSVSDKSVFTVTDVWTGQAVPVVPGANGFAATVGPHDLGVYRLKCISNC